MRSTVLLAAVLLSSGCQILFFDVDDDDDDDDCLLAEADTQEPSIAPAPLRDPGTLTCQSFGGGCNDACGPCPPTPAVALTPPIPPIPSWNICGHSCEGLDQGACAANPACRVVEDARCSVQGNCLTNFLGCFPTDTVPDATVDCLTADAWDCSRSNQCTALHRQDLACPPSGDGQCARPFAMCIPEGTDPGRCDGEVACRALPPPCPSGTTPGISGTCWSGTCIPLELCDAQ